LQLFCKPRVNQEATLAGAALIQWQGLCRVAKAPQMWFPAAQFEIE
jgi:hypothetical protein